MKKVLNFIQNHGLLSGCVGSILAALIGIYASPVVLSTNYVSVNSFDVLVDKYFVKSGFVSEDILTLEIDEQLETIANQYSGIKSELEGHQDDLKDILVASGADSVTATNMSYEDTLAYIKKQVGVSESQQDTIESLKKRVAELEAQTTAEIATASLVVDGQQIDSNIPNSVAKIDGHFFFAETLLNSFLEDEISFDVSKSTVFYGSERAEKTVFQTDMITDISGFSIYSVGTGNSFTIGTEVYDNGLVKHGSSSSRFYANLKGAYSKMSFVVGHIDGSDLKDATIYVYTKNGNDQYRLLKTFELTPDIFPEEKTVEINYADGIQVVIEGNYWADYALADIYLYR